MRPHKKSTPAPPMRVVKYSLPAYFLDCVPVRDRTVFEKVRIGAVLRRDPSKLWRPIRRGLESKFERRLGAIRMRQGTSARVGLYPVRLNRPKSAVSLGNRGWGLKRPVRAAGKPAGGQRT